MEKVVAVVVTYNRKILLKECLDAILEQSYPIKSIVLIDNASTDGTEKFLREQGYLNLPQINYQLMSSNTGGSGGFYVGIKLARELDASWVWVMDDDTIPKKDCLEKLIQAYRIVSEDEKPTAYLASAIYGAEGEFMNLPAINNKPSNNGYAYWYKYLDQGIVAIKNATFVSVLFNMEAIRKCGLPCKEYFIWGDDIEYTQRLMTYFGEGYFVGNSVAIHKRIGAHALDINRENESNKIQRYYYLYRNNLINGMYYDNVKAPSNFALWKMRVKCFLSKGLDKERIAARLKGYQEAKAHYHYFRDYINTEIGRIDK